MNHCQQHHQVEVAGQSAQQGTGLAIFPARGGSWSRQVRMNCLNRVPRAFLPRACAETDAPPPPRPAQAPLPLRLCSQPGRCTRPCLRRCPAQTRAPAAPARPPPRHAWPRCPWPCSASRSARTPPTRTPQSRASRPPCCAADCPACASGCARSAPGRRPRFTTPSPPSRSRPFRRSSHVGSVIGHKAVRDRRCRQRKASYSSAGSYPSRRKKAELQRPMQQTVHHQRQEKRPRVLSRTQAKAKTPGPSAQTTAHPPAQGATQGTRCSAVLRPSGSIRRPVPPRKD